MGLGFRVEGFRAWFLGLSERGSADQVVQSLEFRSSGFVFLGGFRFSVFFFRVPGAGFRTPGFESHFSGFVSVFGGFVPVFRVSILFFGVRFRFPGFVFGVRRPCRRACR